MAMVAHSVSFPPFSVDLANEQLWHGDTPIVLRRQTFAVLRYLIEHAGQVVTKQTLLEALWPGIYVTDVAPMICINELRKVLGDEVRRPRFIETVHRRGYRFIVEVAGSQHSVVSSQNEKRQKAKIEDQSSVPNTQHPTPTLVGRETELAQLHHWLDKALRGERQIVFVTDEAGIGKTTLVEAFLEGVGNLEIGVGPLPPQSLNPKSQIELPGLVAGSVWSTMMLANRICRC